MIKKEHIILPNMSFEEGIKFIEKQYVLPFETEKGTSYYSLESNETWLEIKDILKRNEPVKVTVLGVVEKVYGCPKCHAMLEIPPSWTRYEYCYRCGQKLDWQAV